MPLSQCSLNSTLTFSLQAPVTGFGPLKAGPDSNSFNLAGLNIGLFNQIYVVQETLAPSASVNIDLTNLKNLVNETINFTSVLTILVTPMGGPVTLTPGASNGQTWFLGGTSPSITIPAGGGFAFTDAVAGPGSTVDGTHKVLTFTNNSGSLTTVVDILILGAT